jgi:hypothetical protein
VVKRYRRRRIVGVTHRVIFGAAETIESILAKRGWKSNSAFVERLHLDLRQPVAAIGRRVTTVCKHEAGLRQQLTLFQVYHNCVLPHASLRLSLPELEPVPGPGAIKCWQPRPPAMAAGLTDRVWSVREVLQYRVPPWPQPQVGEERGESDAREPQREKRVYSLIYRVEVRRCTPKGRPTKRSSESLKTHVEQTRCITRTLALHDQMPVRGKNAA